MNYVCNRVSDRIRWDVWCLSSLTETCCSDSYTELGEQILARENTTITANLCGSDDSRSMHYSAIFHNQLDVSNLTITALQLTNTKLRIVCERMNLDCQYLQVAGEMS